MGATERSEILDDIWVALAPASRRWPGGSRNARSEKLIETFSADSPARTKAALLGDIDGLKLAAMNPRQDGVDLDVKQGGNVPWA